MRRTRLTMAAGRHPLRFSQRRYPVIMSKEYPNNDHSARDGLRQYLPAPTNQPDHQAHQPPRRLTRPTHTQHTRTPPPPKPHPTPNQTPNHTTKPNPHHKTHHHKNQKYQHTGSDQQRRGRGKGGKETRRKGERGRKRRGEKRKISAHGFEPRTAFITQSGLIGSVTIERVKVASCPAQRDTCASPRTADVLITRPSDPATQVVYPQ